MSKKNNSVNKKGNTNKKNEVVERDYKNPVETKAGKIVIWLLIIGMVGVVVAGTVLAILQALNII